jgi:hypothetical protein
MRYALVLRLLARTTGRRTATRLSPTGSTARNGPAGRPERLWTVTEPTAA